MRLYEVFQISENEQKVRNILNKDKFLDLKQKKNLLKVYKSLTTNESLSLDELQLHEFIDDSNRETVKKVFLGIMGLVYSTNTLASAFSAGDALADVDGDGDIDFDDQNDITSDQIDDLELNFNNVAQQLKSPDFQNLRAPEKEALLDVYQELEDKLQDVIQWHSMAQSQDGDDDAKKTIDTFHANKQAHDIEQIKLN